MTAAQMRWLFFSFSGRVSRAPYVLAALLMTVVLGFLLYRVILAQESGGGSGMWDVLFSIGTIAALWAQAALGVKRVHDLGRPGIFAAALFLPALNAIAFIVLCILPGEQGPNQYGQVTNAPA